MCLCKGSQCSASATGPDFLLILKGFPRLKTFSGALFASLGHKGA